MSSKLRHRCTTGLTCVAILVLVAVIASVWVMLGRGAFRSKQRRDAVTESTSAIGMKEYIEKTHLNDLNSEVEFVKPLKISPLPLHEHDIIFDQMRNNYDKPPLRHHSGHFRHKEAEVWDPHPRYMIDAFGRQLFLELEHDDAFLAPDLHITHVWDNFTHWTKQDSTMYGCYYTGKIKDDTDSDVSVSLCNGMTGYIRTSQDNYYIEPAEKTSGDSLSSFLHRIKKIPHNSAISDNDVVNSGESDQCETNDGDDIVEDDFGGAVVALPTHHAITKRQVIDDVGDVVRERRRDGVSRTTREADWPVNYEADRKSNAYFLKVLVVADRSMVQYHRSTDDLKHYILILMSHAALLYKDASIGNSISLSVVNIWMLNNTVFTSNNSQVMLRKFCEWQKRYVPDRRHDMALLITRDPICKKNSSSSSSCDTLGVAEVGSMCNPSSSCAIVKERGLSSSYTIAHELGHVLGMLHDETESCSYFSRGPISINIMSRTLNNGTKPWMWSECSKHFVTEFLESNRAKCLNRAPTSDYISSDIADLLPGENFEVNKQCELEFGSGFKVCPFENQPSCTLLWCTPNNKGCISHSVPWADGTSCGRGRWCHHGECIPLDRELLSPVAGSWGSWQPWSECSRTCGGGVKYTKRFCDSPVPRNGGAYCTGRGIQYASCNSDSCLGDVPDFREVQCSQFNGVNKYLANLTKDVVWVPKYGLGKRDDLCKLFCRPQNSNAYYPLRDKVADGTKCGLNSFDICVNGICRPGGCDNKLNSKMTLDECGVCGGDNSRCEEITGEYDIAMTGYNQVLRIPRGSSNLDIRQNANNDTNYLVLVDGETGDYVLNSKTMITPQQKDVIFGGVLISYSGSSAAVERITTPKNHKLAKDLVLWVLSGGDAASPDITYRYIINRENAPRYGWRLYRNKWSKCNSICNGTQFMTPVCVELATNKEQRDSYCSEFEKNRQVQKQECNVHCRLRWDVVSRGPCSVDCGEGVRSLRYNCVKIDVIKENYERYREVVDEKHCNVLSKPSGTEACHGRCESTRWEYTDWSECSASCGGGTQHRTAKCVDNDSRPMDELHCFGREKITEQSCNVQKCPVWLSGEWTPCSATCGRGYRTKPYFCHVDGRVYDPSACDLRQHHVEKEECNVRPCADWSVGQWNSCSTSCGEGVRTRKVVCQDLKDNQIVEDSFCADGSKPQNTKLCKSTECAHALPYQRFEYGEDVMSNSIVKYDSDFRWVTGAWSRCSKSCGSGVSSRMVVCRNNFGEENDRLCTQKIPVHTIECNRHACPQWEYGAWGSCDSSCEKRRQVTCRSADGNFVEDSECDKDSKPAVNAKCKLSHCPRLSGDYFNSRRYKWSVGKWKRCSTACGEGQKHRQVVCEDAKLQRTLVDQYCDRVAKPKTATRCEKYNCVYAWVTSPWSQCGARCGQGTQRRNVTCHRVYDKGAVDPRPLDFDKLNPNSYCDLYEKPAQTAVCTAGHCSDLYVWRSEAWGECSQPCGRKGRRTRQIYCIHAETGRKVERRHCPKQSKPRRRVKCNQWRCMYKSCEDIQRHTKTKVNKDYVITIRNRPAWVYCYKMDTSQPEEYITLPADSENYSENYDKRLKNPDVCPDGGRRSSNCDCLDVGPKRSGLTTFWKVRLNITTMRIIGDDFTFSRQNRGMKVPYGTAGDCYSRVERCAQANFSIDLTGTSFKLSEGVRWQKMGKHATVTTDVSDRKVVGRCGGYCGYCVPDISVGLQVEIT